MGRPGEEHVAAAIDRNGVGLVAPTAAEVRGKHDFTTPTDLGNEGGALAGAGTVQAAGRLQRPHHLKIRGARSARHIGVAGGVQRDGAGLVEPAAAEIREVNELRSIRRQPGHESIAFAGADGSGIHGAHMGQGHARDVEAAVAGGGDRVDAVRRAQQITGIGEHGMNGVVGSRGLGQRSLRKNGDDNQQSNGDVGEIGARTLHRLSSKKEFLLLVRAFMGGVIRSFPSTYGFRDCPG